MAWGDRGAALETDLFGSSIDAGWDNGNGAWTTVVWVTGGHIEPNSTSADTVIIRNGETYADDHWATLTIQSDDANSLHSICLRVGSGADDGYFAIDGAAAGDEFGIFEVLNGTPTQIGTGTGASGDIPMSAGEKLIGECEGTTLRCGTDIGGDHEETSETDATYSSGSPGIHLAAFGGVANARATAFEAGNIGAADTEILATSDALILSNKNPVVTVLATPSISDVNTTESWDDGDTGLVITGAGFL